MRKLLAAPVVLLGLIPQAGFAVSSECFPLTDEALKVASWSINKAIHGAVLSIAIVNTGRFRSDVSATGVNGFVRFATSIGEKFELDLELEIAIAPGAEVEQRYTVIGWDRLVATPHASVTATICVHSMTFADGGRVVIN